jgi:CelD/BcsL family acetyltransferase involved in cellulose biosynthesis
MLAFHRFEGTLDDWGTILATFPDAEIFQTPAWMRFIAESHHATPVIAELRDGNEVVGYFAGLAMRKLGIKILGSPFIGWTTDFMGIRLKTGTPKRAAIEALRHFAFRQYGCLHFEFADRQFEPDDLTGLGFHAQRSVSYLVDLKPEEEDIYHRFSSKSCRYPIRKAAKEGVVIEEACDDAFADEYYAQLKDVFAKQNLVPTYGPERVRLLIKHLFPTGNLLLLRAREPRGDCIATGLFLGSNKTAYFWGNASWRQHQHYCPNESLHWHAMRYWKQQGMEVYDFCGGGDYKRKYGGEEVQRFLFYKSKYRWVATARGLAYRFFRWKQRLLGLGKGADQQDGSERP